MPTEGLLFPAWPLPPGVRACHTRRKGGVSLPPYASFNLGDHVGDEAAAVAQNRARLRQLAALPGEPLWLQQVHGAAAVNAEDHRAGHCADACYSERVGEACVVLTADCLPLLLCRADGGAVAAIHAGWRGLLHGVIENTVQAAGGGPWLAWLGPAIGPQAFEVGDEVREAFIAEDPLTGTAFTPGREGHWFCDIYLLARQRLARVGVNSVAGGEYCTYRQADDYYSYRRDGVTGRMASLIWLE